MEQKYHVILGEEVRRELKKHLCSKRNSLESKKRAGVLLALDESENHIPAPVKTIAARNGVSEGSVRKYRKQYVTEGFADTLHRKKRDVPPVPGKVTGEVEAHIIAVCCSTPPEGRSQWSMQLIADRIVLEGVVEAISDETVRRVLKKRNSNHT
jgi:transposase